MKYKLNEQRRSKTKYRGQNFGCLLSYVRRDNCEFHGYILLDYTFSLS